MLKKLLAILLICVPLSTAVGFALGATSAPQSAGAAPASSEVVTQLMKLNKKMATLNNQIGVQRQSPGSVRGLLTIICDYTAPIDCKK